MHCRTPARLQGCECPGCTCLLLLLSCVVTLSALAVPAVSTNSSGSIILTNHFGDLNNDGQANVLDVVLLTRHLNGTQLLASNLLARADLNQDGRSPSADRAILADMIAGRNTVPTTISTATNYPTFRKWQLGHESFQPGYRRRRLARRLGSGGGHRSALGTISSQDPGDCPAAGASPLAPDSGFRHQHLWLRAGTTTGPSDLSTDSRH